MFGKNTGVSAQIAVISNIGTKTTNKLKPNGCNGNWNQDYFISKVLTKRENLLENIKDLIHFKSLHTDDEIEVAPTLDKLSATQFVEMCTKRYGVTISCWWNFGMCH